MDKSICHSILGKLRHKAGENSVRVFASVYFSGHIKHKTSKAHNQIYKLLDDLYCHRGRRVAIAGFRGLGKTTLVTNFLVAHAICYCKEKNIAVCSNTSEQAKEKITDITKMLMGNPLIQEDFPEIFGPTGKMPVCRKGELVTGNGIRIKAYGYKQGIRGSKHGADRPTLAIADDLDSDVNSNNLEQKDKLKEWFMGSFLRVGDEKTNFILLGNIFHRYSVIGDICADGDHHDWEKLRIPILEKFPDALDLGEKCWAIESGREQYQGACGREATEAFYNANKEAMDRGALLIWPERDRIFPIMMEYERDPETFNAEYQNIPRNPAKNVFDGLPFVFWDQLYMNLLGVENYLTQGGRFYGSCDPSTGIMGSRGDNSAITVLGVKEKKAYVLHADIRKRDMNTLIEDIFVYCRKYKFRSFGIETNGGQKYFYDTLTERARAAGLQVNFVEINNGGPTSKETRIQTLSPYLRSGELILCQSHRQLLQEFKDFQNGGKDDGMDSLEMAFRLSLERRCMEPKDAVELINKTQAAIERRKLTPEEVYKRNSYGFLENDKNSPLFLSLRKKPSRRGGLPWY